MQQHLLTGLARRLRSSHHVYAVVAVMASTMKLGCAAADVDEVGVIRAASETPTTCGNGVCEEPTESCDTCPEDCGQWNGTVPVVVAGETYTVEVEGEGPHEATAEESVFGESYLCGEGGGNYYRAFDGIDPFSCAATYRHHTDACVDPSEWVAQDACLRFGFLSESFAHTGLFGDVCAPNECCGWRGIVLLSCHYQCRGLRDRVTGVRFRTGTCPAQGGACWCTI